MFIKFLIIVFLIIVGLSIKEVIRDYYRQTAPPAVEQWPAVEHPPPHLYRHCTYALEPSSALELEPPLVFVFESQQEREQQEREHEQELEEAIAAIPRSPDGLKWYDGDPIVETLQDYKKVVSCSRAARFIRSPSFRIPDDKLEEIKDEILKELILASLMGGGQP